MKRAAKAPTFKGESTMSGNPHPYTLATREDWRINALLAEVQRQHLARLARPATRQRQRRDAAASAAGACAAQVCETRAEASDTISFPARSLAAPSVSN